MAFVQIIEMKTSNIDAVLEISEQWRQATEGKRTLVRDLALRDRNDPNRYLVVAFFDSYESAMENSGLAETEEFAQRLAALVDGPMIFHDLDVIAEGS